MRNRIRLCGILGVTRIGYCGLPLLLLLLACEADPVTEPDSPETGEPRFVFATFRIETGAWGAGIAAQDGGGARALPLRLENPSPDPPDVVIHHVQWSPDGERIA
ncbi:MAG TPA: hypothetical protein VMN78_08425, partial [Longimicrobiales bacterium]|nr:hypothetical protein [Longimicrobiales bacterium]